MAYLPGGTRMEEIAMKNLRPVQEMEDHNMLRVEVSTDFIEKIRNDGEIRVQDLAMLEEVEANNPHGDTRMEDFPSSLVDLKPVAPPVVDGRSTTKTIRKYPKYCGLSNHREVGIKH